MKLAVYFSENMSTLNEFIVYVDFMNFCKIWYQDFLKIDEQNSVGELLSFKYFSRGNFLCNAFRDIFLLELHP